MRPYLALAAGIAITAVLISLIPDNSNISGTIKSVHTGPDAYVTCESHTGEYRVSVVPDTEIYRYHPGQPCPPGEKW